MNKHTPGPWHVGAGNGLGHIFPDTGRTRLEEGGTALYPVASINGGWNAVEDAANGQLIAAAPDLLHALRQIDSNAAESVEWIRRVARAAITKATGGALDLEVQS